MSGLQALNRTHRIMFWMLLGLIALAWLGNRWWYFKATMRDRGGQTTIWVLSGRLTIFVHRGPQLTIPGMPGAAPAKGPGLELQPLSSLGAQPTWFWGFQWRREITTAAKEWTVSIPFWSLAVLVLATRLPLRAAFRRRRGRCPVCGYDLGGIPPGVCPECGTITRRRSPQPRAATSSHPDSE